MSNEEDSTRMRWMRYVSEAVRELLPRVEARFPNTAEDLELAKSYASQWESGEKSLSQLLEKARDDARKQAYDAWFEVINESEYPSWMKEWLCQVLLKEDQRIRNAD